MKTIWALGIALLIGGAVILASSLTHRGALTALTSPPAQVQGESFGLPTASSLSAAGVLPGDVLGIGGVPRLPCEELGLQCLPDGSGNVDQITGLSLGSDFNNIDLPPLQFSVKSGSQGAAGSAVRLEAACATPEAQADVFETPLDGSNFQDLDGDGVACATNTGYGLGLVETTITGTIDELTNLDQDPCPVTDVNCDGIPEAPLFLTLSAGSPSLATLGISTADIIMTGGAFPPTLWASRDSLGLTANDVIDALCVRENGNGVYDRGDRVLFSLAPGSPTLAAHSASGADILRPSPPTVAIRASALGLLASDDVDALLCNQDVVSIHIFMPVFVK